MTMKPTIGTIVHYTNVGDRDGNYPVTVQAAIITANLKDDNMLVMLHVFYAAGECNTMALFTEEAAGSEEARGKWTWIKRP